MWIDGVKFMTVRSRDASSKRWNRGGYLTYGNDVDKGELVYGPVIVAGFGGDATFRGLTEFEKDVLWSHLLYLS